MTVLRTIPILLAAIACIAPAAAQSRPDTPSITVRGEAASDVVPDVVVVVFGVVTVRPTAADAMAQNSTALANAIAAIKAEGVKAEDIATTGAGLAPEMRAADKDPPKIVGYRAENQLQVRLTPADRAGALLANLVEKGVNDVESVVAMISDDTALRDKLKGAAAENARHQAEIYATALGVTLGPVMQIDPETTPIVPRFAMAEKLARAAPAPVPVAVGRQTVTEAVRVTFALQAR